jgi:hypothetical protein
MKIRSTLLSGAALLALGGALAPAPAAAQSDILLRLRSGSPLGDRFRVDSAGGVVARGSLGIGIIPQSGTVNSGDIRMMWYPYKAAFRAGGPGASGSTAWDDANVGFYTWAGGFGTIATGLYSVALGEGSKATNSGAFAFGDESEATGIYSVAFGERTVAASRGAIAVGANCSPIATCSSAWSGLSWRGATNSNGSSVAMGQYVTADGQWSVALGFRATTAGRVGSFVWGGSLNGASAATDSLQATADGQFSIRAPGGIRMFSNSAMTVGVSVAAGGSSWNVISDRNRKEGFLAVDGEDLLTRLRSVPVTTWRYRDEADRTVRHIGPMAQDWQRAFGFSRDATTINMSDLDGVNLAAVQALERRTASLQAENAALRAQNLALEERMRRLEALVAGSRAP